MVEMHKCLIAFGRARIGARNFLGCLGLVLLLGLWTDMVQGALPTIPKAIFSASGQFVVRSRLPAQGGTEFGLSPSATSDPYVATLNPHLLAVTCERVKRMILNDLGMRDEWKGKISIVLVQMDPGPHPISFAVVSSRFLDGWRYEVALPEFVAPEALLRTLTHVVLLEIANRGSVDRSVEIPYWILEGLTHRLKWSDGPDLVLEPDSIQVQNEVKVDLIRMARGVMKAHGSLLFNDLSLPTSELLNLSNRPIFQANSHVFLYELSRLEGGIGCLQRFLALLPKYLNWQFAFLEAFQAHFQTLLQVEKWWAVVLAQDSQRDGEKPHVWAEDFSLSKLKEISLVQVQASAARDSIPKRVELSVTELILVWPFVEQKRVLLQKIDQLAVARLTVAPRFVGWAGEYRAVLLDYLEKRSRQDDPEEVGFRTKRLLQKTMEALEKLDQQLVLMELEP